MDCCVTRHGIAEMFDRRRAQRELERYLRRGVGQPTTKIVEILIRQKITGYEILEIGFGIGALHLELLQAGAARAVGLELSPAYIETARELARRLGFEQAVSYRLHNIAEQAGEVAAADLVLMNRVICCYGDLPGLVTPAARRARHYFLLSFPLEAWWTRLGVKILNGWLALARREFRTYLHSPAAVRATAEAAGLTQILEAYSGFWQIVLFERLNGDRSAAPTIAVHDIKGTQSAGPNSPNER
jgi:magnesium-protoporphyrin O-methyltransferase